MKCPPFMTNEDIIHSLLGSVFGYLFLFVYIYFLVHLPICQFINLFIKHIIQKIKWNIENGFGAG